MITALQITKYFYKILNKQSLLDVIDGGIYRFNKPKNSENQDVVINTVFLDSGLKNEIQNGKANINIFCKDLNGQPDIYNLELISNEVLNLLSNNTQSNNLFSYEITGSNILKDPQQNSLSYININLDIHNY